MKKNEFNVDVVDVVEVNLARSLALANHLVDSDLKKLSDKCHDLELSHNRMKKLLNMSRAFLEMYAHGGANLEIAECLHKRLTLELYGLENYKGLKGG